MFERLMETTQFWKLTPPEYSSDYDHSLINGSLEHPFGMPGVECSVCNQTSGGCRILSAACPPSLREKKEIKSGWPIPLENHKLLQELVRGELAKTGVKVDRLSPGDRFQPAYLDVPSLPHADFLWSSLGSVVVSQRVKEVLEQPYLNDVIFSEVTMRKVGRQEAKLPAPVPSTGEPEDLINELPLLETLDSVGRYYEMIILKDSCYPPSRTPKSICPGCRRPDVEVTTKTIEMTPEMWQGDSIFFLATTLYVIVTDQVKEMLENIGVTNIVFSEM